MFKATFLVNKQILLQLIYQPFIGRHLGSREFTGPKIMRDKKKANQNIKFSVHQKTFSSFEREITQYN